MKSVYFVGPYKTLTCIIADYTEYLVRVSPAGICAEEITGYGMS